MFQIWCNNIPNSLTRPYKTTHGVFNSTAYSLNISPFDLLRHISSESVAPCATSADIAEAIEIDCSIAAVRATGE